MSAGRKHINVPDAEYSRARIPFHQLPKPSSHDNKAHAGNAAYKTKCRNEGTL